jgi:hypothetical protein
VSPLYNYSDLEVGLRADRVSQLSARASQARRDLREVLQPMAHVAGGSRALLPIPRKVCGEFQR